uniref:Tick transposon n=1 Tax=Rhipicephalus appendiculatus TaxID=34631 RepID=A0A131YX77_RHIAP
MVGVVYRIPLSCGRVYIGQSGKCINERLRQHNCTLKGTPTSHFCTHCRACGCKPFFDNTVILRKHSDRRARELAEAYFIKDAGDDCISEPSVCLLECELRKLNEFFCNS